jgi:hypothetical protein
MVAKHVDTPVVKLYIVSFKSNVGEDGKNWENDEEEDDGGRVNYLYITHIQINMHAYKMQI